MQETLPDEIRALCAQGNALAGQGRFDQALLCYERATGTVPNSAEVLFNRATILLHIGRPGDALACLDRALNLGLTSAFVHVGRGNALSALGRRPEALDSFEAARKLDPDNALAHGNHGNTLFGMGRLDDALASLERAVELAPRDALIRYNHANVLLALGRQAEAAEGFGYAVQLAPAFSLAWYNHGNALVAQRRLGPAVESFTRTVELDPRYAPAFNNRGGALLEMNQPYAAIPDFQRALELQPAYAGALENLGQAHREIREYDTAAQNFAQLLALDAEFPYARGNLLDALCGGCDWTKGFGALRTEALGALRAGRRSVAPLALLHLTDDPQDQLQCARTYVTDKFPPATRALWNGDRYEHSRIRVAYLSADFGQHATANLMAELFERHDHQGFEWSAISFGPDRASPIRRRLQQAFDRFLDVGSRSDFEVARLLRDLEIDIAIDLKGFTAHCRLGVFALRPAPVQVSYLGYPGTVGAPYIDYIIADRQLISPEERCYFSEKIIELPDSYQANDRQRPIASQTPHRSEAGLPEQAFVFCCFNASRKIGADMFAVWMRLLRAVPGSVLWLLDDNATAVDNLRREANRSAVDPARLVFAPRLSLDAHLARHRLADLFLDTLPYNAHTTASDALWAGLPLLTCRGRSFAGRVASSLLAGIGLAELVTHSLEDYERLAITLATDRGRLLALREALAGRRLSAPLFDAERLRRQLESAFGAIWQRAQAGLSPDHIEVQPC